MSPTQKAIETTAPAEPDCLRPAANGAFDMPSPTDGQLLCAVGAQKGRKTELTPVDATGRSSKSWAA